jgi:hypothetical protein
MIRLPDTAAGNPSTNTLCTDPVGSMLVGGPQACPAVTGEPLAVATGIPLANTLPLPLIMVSTSPLSQFIISPKRAIPAIFFSPFGYIYVNTFMLQIWRYYV